MLCFVEYTPDGRRAISARPRLELHLSHVAISTRNDDIEGRLYRNSENEFQHPSFISTDLMWENRYFARVRHAGILYIYISQCPRFCETCKGGKKKKMRKEKGSEQTPGIIFLIPLFSPPLSQEGFCGSELLIHSLHSICTACHFYQIICGISHSAGHILLIQYLHFISFGIRHLWQLLHTPNLSHTFD